MFTNATIAVLKYGYCHLKEFWRTRSKNTRSSLLSWSWPWKKFIMKKMERKQASLPPSWCSSICRNSMQDVCVEECAIKRDCSWFEPKEGLNLEDMPRFPFKETSEMTREEKFVSVTIYLSKVVDHLKGYDDERKFQLHHKRSHVNRFRSSQISSPVEVSSLLDGAKEEASLYQAEPAPDSNKGK